MGSVIKNNPIWHGDKDVAYVKEQDYNFFISVLPRVLVRFVDQGNTQVDVFGSQELIYLLPPLEIPVMVKFDNLNSIQDRLNLPELPEAVAVFSKSVMEMTGLPDNKKIVEPDVLLIHNDIVWRITDVFKNDFIGHRQRDFLHYECVLERNSRTNYRSLGGKPIVSGDRPAEALPVNSTDYITLILQSLADDPDNVTLLEDNLDPGLLNTLKELVQPIEGLTTASTTIQNNDLIGYDSATLTDIVVIIDGTVKTHTGPTPDVIDYDSVTGTITMSYTMTANLEYRILIFM